ncbi:TetR/AcrR family transcriptional regulator [Pseudactinotalea sp.]|uniref:TetR/AcrR family transcriptional regulator n=1 Tax=Pseudactinotalea sp. TaxID=1926260 RepID=UPI003B3B4F7F
MNDYHHGDLRRAVLDRALEIVADQGASALSLRAIATDLGVSHTAPRHHFGSNTGLLTAIAVEGFGMLRDRLVELRLAQAPFIELGVAYVEFAAAHPGHFAVMFQPTLLDGDDPALAEASDGAFAELRAGVEAIAPAAGVAEAAAAVTAAWSLMHGLAALDLTGNLERSRIREMLGVTDLAEIARRAGGLLGGSSGAS